MGKERKKTDNKGGTARRHHTGGWYVCMCIGFEFFFRFNTGNHPVEMFVPMLHFKDVGFTFDIATARGKPVVLEMWAYPNKDESVKALYEEVNVCTIPAMCWTASLSS